MTSLAKSLWEANADWAERTLAHGFVRGLRERELAGEVKAGGAGLFIEARFHDVFTDGPNTQFIPINVGIRFGGT